MESKPGISEKMVKLRMLKCLNAIIISQDFFRGGQVPVAKFGLGRLATQQEIKAWNIDIRPDGGGLPQGSGSVVKGEEIYLNNVPPVMENLRSHRTVNPRCRRKTLEG